MAGNVEQFDDGELAEIIFDIDDDEVGVEQAEIAGISDAEKKANLTGPSL